MSSIPDSLEEQIRARLRPSPLYNPQFRVRRFGDDAQQPIRFYIYNDVLEELAYAASYDDAPICAAILVGGFGMEDEGGFVEVSGFHGLEWVDTLDDLYDTVRETTDAWLRSASEDALVGLFVAAGGCAGRVEPEVARVHLSLFNIPFQPLLALDPGEGRLGVYARSPGKRFFEAAFRAVAANSRSTTLKAAESSGTPAGSEE